jgi:hypothetical protein
VGFFVWVYVCYMRLHRASVEESSSALAKQSYRVAELEELLKASSEVTADLKGRLGALEAECAADITSHVAERAKFHAAMERQALTDSEHKRETMRLTGNE